MLPRHG
ncbi:Protein of unknown function, partial [Gryllus bimaculatus]